MNLVPCPSEATPNTGTEEPHQSSALGLRVPPQSFVGTDFSEYLLRLLFGFWVLSSW
jgi:hypothetical protein